MRIITVINKNLTKNVKKSITPTAVDACLSTNSYLDQQPFGNSLLRPRIPGTVLGNVPVVSSGRCTSVNEYRAQTIP